MLHKEPQERDTKLCLKPRRVCTPSPELGPWEGRGREGFLATPCAAGRHPSQGPVTHLAGRRWCSAGSSCWPHLGRLKENKRCPKGVNTEKAPSCHRQAESAPHLLPTRPNQQDLEGRRRRPTQGSSVHRESKAKAASWGPVGLISGFLVLGQLKKIFFSRNFSLGMCQIGIRAHTTMAANRPLTEIHSTSRRNSRLANTDSLAKGVYFSMTSLRGPEQSTSQTVHRARDFVQSASLGARIPSEQTRHAPSTAGHGRTGPGGCARNPTVGRPVPTPQPQTQTPAGDPELHEDRDRTNGASSAGRG